MTQEAQPASPALTPDDIIILISAFRYALGRMTYVPVVVVNRIKRDWPSLDVGTRQLIHREVRDALERHQLGMSCDAAAWKQLLELPLELRPRT